MNNVKHGMTKKVNMTLLATLISAAVFVPQAMAGDDGARGHRHAGGEKIFQRLDTNSDGVLTLEEMTAPIDAKVEKVFARKDSDEDGLLSLEEFSTNRRGESVDLSEFADEIVQCVADLKDETGNENINVPEASQFTSPAERFAAIDTSGDGFIDLAELQASKLAKVTEGFNNTDTDSNGEVSADEFKAKWQMHKATKRAIHQCVNEILDSED